MDLLGNIVQMDRCFYGKLQIFGSQIGEVKASGPCQPDADWILPGFIDVHLHGIYYGDATPESVHLMPEQAPQSGLTTLCPAMASDTPEAMLDFVRKIKNLMANPAPDSARLAGSHLEGPFLNLEHCGGMNEQYLRSVDFNEVEKWLAAADGTLKIVTLAPELPRGMELTAFLTRHNVRVSAGHTAMKPEDVTEFIAAGGKSICHLFDTFNGRNVIYGVPEVCTADEVIINDNLFLELITDTFHVPPTLAKLAIRAAGVDRILGITDSLCGTGLPDGAYPMTDAGRAFTLTNGEVCRLTDDPTVIVGSCLTQNQAFYNLTEKFGFSECCATRILSTNAARYLNIDHLTGSLNSGLAADIAVLANNKKTVKSTFIGGREVYRNIW